MNVQLVAARRPRGVAGSLTALLATLLAFLAFATPASAALTERNVYYRYDIMGRQLTAKFDSASGADGITNTLRQAQDRPTTALATS